MSKISEFFGLYCKNTLSDFKQAMETQMCPYTQRVCTKMRKSNPEIKIRPIIKKIIIIFICVPLNIFVSFFLVFIVILDNIICSIYIIFTFK